jgi:hypothetical protein
MADKGDRYRVVGVRADGSEHVLSVSLSLDDASYLEHVLRSNDIFTEVLIEPNEPTEKSEPNDSSREAR